MGPFGVLEALASIVVLTPVQVGCGATVKLARMTSRWISPVGADSAGSDAPAALAATTRTRIVAPTSSRVSLYVLAVAPATSLHPVPAAVEQRRHWYWKEVGASLHVPVDAVRTSSSRASPLTTGSAVFCGGPPATGPVSAEDAVSIPPPDAVAVTS